jgi:phosphoserine phosphatase RsbU/P
MKPHGPGSDRSSPDPIRQPGDLLRERVMEMSPSRGLFAGDWQQRLALIVETMREMSRQTDPQAMVRAYVTRVRKLMPTDRWISLGRRDLEFPKYRITRSSTWEHEVDPWKERDRLPVLEGGILGELIYGDQPRIINDLTVADDDPAADFLRGMGSLAISPQYDRGVALNMVVMLRREPGAFDPEEFPEWVWLTNLFGRATHNLVLSDQLQQSYGVVERELKVVADLQRSLLPKRLPKIPTLELAAHYQTSRWAGGDYYDVFPLPDGKWGLLIADVSGHGTPAAVMMAVTHSIVHTYPGHPDPPGKLLEFINHHLATRYMADIESFVTAFYGIYDPARRTLIYASAGHNPPRLMGCGEGSVTPLDGVSNLPLGIDPGATYQEHPHALRAGDRIVFYTDGVTEAHGPDGRSMFGVDRLDAILKECHVGVTEIIAKVLAAVEDFTDGRPAADDRTLLVAKVS